MSRCAYPPLGVSLNVPKPDLPSANLPISFPPKAPSVKMPGRPNLSILANVPKPDLPSVNLPISFPPKKPSVKMPGRPNLSVNLNVPSKQLPGIDFPPPIRVPSCPLDVKA